MSGRRGKEQREGPLKGHFKQGRIYRPALLAYEETVPSDWVKDDFPDMLWPALLVARYRDEGIVRFRKVQDLIIGAVGEDALDAHNVEFDGRLTSIELIPEALRPRILAAFKNSRIAGDAMPPELFAALRLYADVPGAWLLLDPFTEVDTRPTVDDAADVLLRTVVEVVSDGHLNALVKCAPLGWLVLRGKISMPASEVEVLRDYPLNPTTRPMADAMIRSGFLASKAASYGQHPERHEAIVAWAGSFWRQNWHHFRCLPEEQEVIGEPSGAEAAEAVEDDGHEDEREDEGDVAAIAGESLRRVVEMFNAFLERVLDPTAPVDLYAPAKHEVICGFVSRATRAVAAALRAPHLWSGEHGMTPMRVIAEATILLGWMDQQDASVYERFQNYGRGKAKLMKRHIDAMVESFPGDPPADLVAFAKRLGDKLGGDWGQQFQEISVESTFSGLTLRQMAAEAGLDDVYRHVYQPASGVTHGEWWAIEEYTMQRCLNPLHLFHMIPSAEPEFPITAAFGPLLVRQLGRLIDRALGMLFPATRFARTG